jgi:TIGR03009 family protein
MRLSGLAIAASLALAAAAVAQQAPPRLSSAPEQSVAPPVPADPELDRCLSRWEHEMQSFQTLALKITRVDQDKVLGVVTKYSGIAYFMKSGTGPAARNLVLLQTSRDGTNELAEKFVCTGTYFYYFDRATKEVQARELPRAAAGAMPDDNFLGMFGLRAGEAKRRYNLKLTNQDANFVYIEIVPRFARDKEEFVWARIVLNKKDFLPRQLQYRQPNNNEVVWDIPHGSAVVDGKMDPRWFDKPEPPPGWKFVKLPTESDAPTRTFRNNAP